MIYSRSEGITKEAEDIALFYCSRKRCITSLIYYTSEHTVMTVFLFLHSRAPAMFLTMIGDRNIKFSGV